MRLVPGVDRSYPCAAGRARPSGSAPRAM